MIRASLTNAGPAVDRLVALGPRTDAALADAAKAIAGQLRDIAARNLSGGVLKARTGALRASLTSRVDRSADGVMGVIGADTPYARFQEYGFTGIETVRARRRAAAAGRKTTARTHERRVDYPGRSYLRVALTEIAPDIRTQLAAAVAKALAS